jgi:hypothetical protein
MNESPPEMIAAPAGFLSLAVKPLSLPEHCSIVRPPIKAVQDGCSQSEKL